MKSNWLIKKLGEICSFEGGTQPPKNVFKYEPQEGYVRLLQIRDFSSDDKTTYIPGSPKLRRCNADDILIGRYGASVGKILRGKTGAYNVAIIKTIPNEKSLLKNYLFLFLQSPETQRRFINFTKRAAQAGFTKEEIGAFEIPLPPLSEQKRIVERIEKILGKIEKVKKLREEAIKETEIIISAALAKTFEKFKNNKIPLRAVCKYQGGSQPPKSTFIYEPREGYIRLVQIRDYKSDKNTVYIPLNTRHKTCNETDIMIGRYGPPVFQILKGKSGAYNVALIKCIPNKERLKNNYLYYFLRSDPVQRHIIGLSMRVRQAGVRPDDLDKLKIPLPDLKKQEEIVKYLDSFSEEVEELKKYQQEQLKELEELKQSILNKELKGEFN